RRRIRQPRSSDTSATQITESGLRAAANDAPKNDRPAAAQMRREPMTKLMIAVALAFAAALAGASSASAQGYPSRQITMIVPFPPGGSTDVAARIMAERMRPVLGQPVIIEN